MNNVALKQSSLELVPHLCLFCYKNINLLSCGKSIRDDSDRMKCLKHFMKTLWRLEGRQSNQNSDFESDIQCCEDCLGIIREFNEIYHNVKCLELKLLWKLDNIVNIMKLANRVPSRVSQVSRSFTEMYPHSELAENKLKSFKSLRHKLIKTCNWKLFKTQPRVTLRPLLDSNPIIESAVMAKANQTIPLLSQLEAFLGWTMSFVAVALLTSFSDGVNTTIPEMDIQQMIFDDEDKSTNLDNVCNKNAHGHNGEKLASKLSNQQTRELSSVQDNIPITKTEISMDSIYQRIDEDFSNFDNIASPHCKSDYSGSSHSEHNSTDNEKETTSKQKPTILSQTEQSKQPVLFCCKICQEKCKDKKHLQMHLQKAHNVFTSKPHACRTCNLKFLNASTLRKHKRAKSHQMLWKVARKQQLPIVKTEIVTTPPHIQSAQNIANTKQQTPSKQINKVLKTSAKPSKLLKRKTEPLKSEKLVVQKSYNFRTRTASGFQTDNRSDMEYLPSEEETNVLVQQKPINISSTSNANNLALETAGNKRKDEDALTQKTNDWKCNTCNKTFLNHLGLLGHNRAIHNQYPAMHKCLIPECKRSFSSAQLLEQHQRLHGNWKCQFCNEIKNYAPDLAFHEVQHAYRETLTKEETKLWCCARCDQNYKMKSLYKHHFLQYHLKLMNSYRACPICGAEGNLGETKCDFLRQHTKRYHNVEGMAAEDIPRCDLCPAYFTKNTMLEHHKMLVHWEKKCPECGKLFLERFDSFRVHIQYHHFHLMPHWKFACSIEPCKRRFATQQELDNHLGRCFFRKETHQCSACGKVFTGKQNLSIHMKTAHGEKKFVCQICGKGFRTKASLEVHSEYHKSPDEWKFECGTCGRKFADNCKLKQHQRTHTKEKPFICNYCGEKYAHRHNWRNHVKTKHADETDS